MLVRFYSTAAPAFWVCSGRCIIHKASDVELQLFLQDAASSGEELPPLRRRVDSLPGPFEQLQTELLLDH